MQFLLWIRKRYEQLQHTYNIKHIFHTYTQKRTTGVGPDAKAIPPGRKQKQKEQQHPKLQVKGLTQGKLNPAAKPAGETDSETDKPRLPGIHSRTSVDIQKQC